MAILASSADSTLFGPPLGAMISDAGDQSAAVAFRSLLLLTCHHNYGIMPA